MNEPLPTSADFRFNRRNFLKSTSKAIAGGALLGGLSIERSAFAAGGDTLKIALIGCGGRGSGAADQALSADPNAKLIAMADVFPRHLKEHLNGLSGRAKEAGRPGSVDVPEDRQFIGFEAYKQAIALADVVILATPPGFRPYHFEAAVEAGKHIFMEKPVATDAPGVRRVLAAAKIAKEKNLKVAVGLQRRHHPGYQEAMKRLHDGAIGDIVAMRAYWNGTRPWQHPRREGMTEMEFQMDNWYYFTWICGDHIVEQHIHNLDVINWMKQGHPVKAYGMGGCQIARTSNDGEIFDHHAVEFEYADGSRLSSQCRHIKGCWDSVTEHAVGTLGSVDLSDNGNKSVKAIEIKGKNAWDRKGHGEDAWGLEHFPFFDAIRNNKPYMEAEYGAESTMTAIMGRMATYTGRELKWDECINSKVVLAPDNFAWDAVPKSAVGEHGLYPMAIPGDPAWFKKVIG